MKFDRGALIPASFVEAKQIFTRPTGLRGYEAGQSLASLLVRPAGVLINLVVKVNCRRGSTSSLAKGKDVHREGGIGRKPAAEPHSSFGGLMLTLSLEIVTKHPFMARKLAFSKKFSTRPASSSDLSLPCRM